MHGRRTPVHRLVAGHSAAGALAVIVTFPAVLGFGPRAGEAAEFRLRSQCQGEGSLITLGDVAEIFAADEQQAKALAAAMKGMEWDIIICGKEAFDDSSGIVGPLVAEFLGIPHITTVVKLSLSPEERTVIVEREIEGGKEVIKAPLPVLLTAQKGLNEPRVPPVTGVMKAMRTEIKKLDGAAIGLSQDEVGKGGSQEEILRYHRPPQRPPVTMIQGEAVDIVKQVVTLLKDEAKVI